MKKSLLKKFPNTINSRSFRASFQHKKKFHAASFQSSDCNGKRELFKRRKLNDDSAEERNCSSDLQETKEDGNIQTFAEKCNKDEQESNPNVDASSRFVAPTKDAGENIIPASSQQSTISKPLKVELENEEQKEKLGCPVTVVFSQQGQVPDLGRGDSTTLKIMKKISKKVHKLNKKQKEERVNFYKTFDEEKEQLENVHRVESALYRILYEEMPMKAHKLKLLSERHSKESDDLKRRASENLEDLCAKQLDLRNKEEELNALRLKKWKETKFKLQESYRDSAPARVVDTVPDKLAVSQEVQPDGDDISVSESAVSSMLTPINLPSMPPVSDPGDGLQLPLHEASNSQCVHILEPTGVQDDAAVITATNSPWQECVVEEKSHNKHVDAFQASGESSQISKCSGVADIASTVAGNNGPLQTNASHLASLSVKLYLEAPTKEPVISSNVPATIDSPASKMITTPAEEVPESCKDNVAELPSLSTNLHLPEDQPHPQSSHESHHLEAPTEEPVASPHVPASVHSPASEMLNTPADEVPDSCVDNIDVLPLLSTNLCLPEDQPRPQSAHESHQPSLETPVTHAASLTATPLIDVIRTEVERTNTVRYTLPAREGQSALGVEVLASHIDNAVPTYQSNTDASVGEHVVQAALPIFTGQHFASAQYHPNSHSPHGHHQASHGWSAPREASDAHMPSNPDPLVSELERILIVKEQTDKTHANTKVHLKSECLKEMTQVYKKYQVKLQEAEAGFLSKKEKLEEYIYKLNMNKLLAEALQTKFMNTVASGQPVRQQAFSSIPQEQQLLRPFSPETVRRLPAALPAHMTLSGPNSTSIQAFRAPCISIDARLSSVARLPVTPLTPSPLRPSFPAIPSSLSQQEARPRAVFPVAPPLQRVHDSSKLFSANPAGNPTPIYSPVLNIQSVSGIRGPAPHLRHRNSSMPETVALQPWLSNQQC